MNDFRQRQFHPNVNPITEILIRRFGRQTLSNKRNPLDELWFILLSSKTPPSRYQDVYRRLKRNYPKSDDLATARWEDVAAVISDAGLQNRKAKAIASISRLLKNQYRKVTLTPLRRLPDEVVETFLTSLPEVSIKTARCVMLYALDRAVFPVDSHCFRICKRLGWISGEKSLTDRVADFLQDGVPPALRRDLHVGMVLLGRQYCTPKDPLCETCPILEFCPTGLKAISLSDKEGEPTEIPTTD